MCHVTLCLTLNINMRQEAFSPLTQTVLTFVNNGQYNTQLHKHACHSTDTRSCVLVYMSIIQNYYYYQNIVSWGEVLYTTGRPQTVTVLSALADRKLRCWGCHRHWITLSPCSAAATLGNGFSRSPAQQWHMVQNNVSFNTFNTHLVIN